ncbi:MAG: hypothetical protein U1E17_18560 [Geminicoccaceae bacterium]
MSRPGSGQFGKGQAPRPNAAEARVDNERYETFQGRLQRIAAAARAGGRTALADQLVDLGQQVADRELTLDEGLAELRGLEAQIRAALKR